MSVHQGVATNQIPNFLNSGNHKLSWISCLLWHLCPFMTFGYLATSWTWERKGNLEIGSQRGDLVFQMIFAKFPGEWGQGLKSEFCVPGVWVWLGGGAWVGKKRIESCWLEKVKRHWEKMGRHWADRSELAIRFFPFKASSHLIFCYYTYPENMERIISALANLFPTRPAQRMQKWGENWFWNIITAHIFW